jgi:hypothetical protein
MITNFKKFSGEITYDDAKELAKAERKIKDHYYKTYKGSKPPFSMNREFSKTSIQKTLNFAKNMNDKEMLDLIENYFNEIERIDIKKDTRKYNI